MESGQTSQSGKRQTQIARRNPTPPGTIPEFDLTHFSTPALARRFHTWFMSCTVITYYFTDLDAFDQLSICNGGAGISWMGEYEVLVLVGWESMLSIE